MCFDTDSEPPIQPIAGAAVNGRSLELTADDGTRLASYLAEADEPSGAGMLILPDTRGLHHYYEELALRFAEAGIDALSLDYFGRTAGTGDRGDDFDFRPHVGQLTWAGLQADIRAGAEALRRERGVTSLFTIGFCMGGRLSFLAGTLPDVAATGVVGFYGWPVGERSDGVPAPADVADQITASVLAIFGEADQGISPENVATFEQALDKADVDHRVVTYPDAGHSFFDRKQSEFAEASTAAWREVLDFVRARTRAGGTQAAG